MRAWHSTAPSSRGEGFEKAHIVGNSLGGLVALQLAARGRAASVVALAPAGGWAEGDEAFKELLRFQLKLHKQAKAGAPYADAIVAAVEGRRRATRLITTNFEHIPADLLAHQICGVARCDATPLIKYATRERYTLEAAGSRARYELCGVRLTSSWRGRLPPRASATTGYRRLSGWSSRASATALSSTSRW